MGMNRAKLHTLDEANAGTQMICNVDHYKQGWHTVTLHTWSGQHA